MLESRRMRRRTKVCSGGGGGDGEGGEFIRIHRMLYIDYRKGALAAPVGMVQDFVYFGIDPRINKFANMVRERAIE